MRYVVMGSVESTRVCLGTLASIPDVTIAGVVTLPKELSHRHSDYVDLSTHARNLGVPVVAANDCNSPFAREQVARLEPDFLVVVGSSQVVRQELRNIARHGAFGFHPAPLPRFRGRAAQAWTILLDEKISGSTFFWLDDSIDSGPILAQRFLHVAPDETVTSLCARHLEALRDMLLEVVPQLEAGQAPRQPQDERYATWCAKRVPADGEVDWTQPARSVWRLIRAVTRPYPGAFTHDASGQQLFLWSALPAPEEVRQAALPGQVVARSTTGFAVRCGDGRDLLITEFTGAGGAACLAPRLHARLGVRPASGARP
jgi:methionyl-tRNA formyltransferase